MWLRTVNEVIQRDAVKEIKLIIFWQNSKFCLWKSWQIVISFLWMQHLTSRLCWIDPFEIVIFVIWNQDKTFLAHSSSSYYLASYLALTSHQLAWMDSNNQHYSLAAILMENPPSSMFASVLNTTVTWFELLLTTGRRSLLWSEESPQTVFNNSESWESPGNIKPKKENDYFLNYSSFLPCFIILLKYFTSEADKWRLLEVDLLFDS